MKPLYFLIVVILIPITIFSQRYIKDDLYGNKEDRRGTIKYYKKNTDFSRGFINSYVRLLSGRRDIAKAIKQINQLYKLNETVFYRFMRIRLEWEFKEHLMLAPLDSVKSLLKNKSDSAGYYYMQGNYFQDSMLEKLARKFGFVKAVSHDNEVPDWSKIKSFRWNSPIIIESMHGDNTLLDDPIVNNPMMDSSISYYKKAIEKDPAEFFYMKELVFFLNKHYQESALQQAIKQYQNNYPRREKKWLNALLTESLIRQKKVVK